MAVTQIFYANFVSWVSDQAKFRKTSNSPYVPKKNIPIGIEDSGDNLLTREIGSMIKGLCTENASVDAHAYLMVGR